MNAKYLGTHVQRRHARRDLTALMTDPGGHFEVRQRKTQVVIAHVTAKPYSTNFGYACDCQQPTPCAHILAVVAVLEPHKVGGL